MEVNRNSLRSIEEKTAPEAGEDREAPVVRLVDSIIEKAVWMQASDIHVEPQEKKVAVRFRQDGFLREMLSLPEQVRLPLVSRLKIMAGMDIAEKRLPQDGRIRYICPGREVDIRASTLPTIFGEKIVLRILDKSRGIMPLEKLGFEDYNYDRFVSMLRFSGGMILITGPTGSGKTTTLYATLEKLRTPGLNVQTIEDPVEYQLEGINQTQVNVKAGLTFAAGLRAILRQDPDIIMVGEIRDRDTAEVAVRAATTGHLVLSTMHTNDAATALTRLLEMGVEPFLVASSVLGVVSQRLVRVLCPNCKKPYRSPAGSSESILLAPEGPEENLLLYAAGGCGECDGTGYRGRIGIQEVLLVTGTIRNLVNKKSSAAEIKEQAVREGMLTLRRDGIQKVRRGMTTPAEILRVTCSEE